MKDYDIARIHEVAVRTVRLTPHDAHGTPEPRWAYTYEFLDPIFIATCRHTCVEHFTRARAFRQGSTVFGAFIVDSDNTDPDRASALAYALWQRRHHGATVEAWADADQSGGWPYVLIPHWIHEADADQWPDEEEPSHRQVTAVGKIHIADGYPWPDPNPLPGTTDTGRPSLYRIGITSVPAPGPGYDAVLTA